MNDRDAGPPAPEEDEQEEKLHEDGLIGHLVDLRSCLLRALGAVAVVFLALFAFHEQVYDWFAAPIVAQLPGGSQLIATDVLGGFLVPAKVVLFCALCLSLPYVLYQLWSFVAPGLYRRERGMI
ncbi:MAG: twin-arginine translocase subunit TatC, partial [Betaproteobacteria bacterium]|nr:twin-arginine translocase subunit TatC [Betaproteobacteria bacterium]